MSPVEPGPRVIAIFNGVSVKEGAADRVVGTFRESRGNVQSFPGFISMEVLRAVAGDEVLVVTRWRDRDAFDAWVHSEELSPPSTLRSSSRGAAGGPS